MEEEWRDPLHLGTSFVQISVLDFCKLVTETLDSIPTLTSDEWLGQWKKELIKSDRSHH